MHHSSWNLDPPRILTRRELAAVLAEAKAVGQHLRASETAGLQLGDVIVDMARPHLRLRRETTKGKKARMVPLWWGCGDA